MNKTLVYKMYSVLLYFSIGVLFSQQDPQYTQYMYNTMSVNPAYAGSNGYTVITALARTQWVGVDGAPDSQSISFDTPIGYSGIGLGVILANDQIGPASEISLDVNGSYAIRTGQEGNLAFGIKLGGRHLGIDWSKGTARQQERIFESNISRFLPTVGAGVYFYNTNFYVGVAVPNIIRTDHYDDNVATADFGSGDVAEEKLHFFGIIGYVMDLTQEIKFKPAALVKVISGAPLSIDVSANFLFYEKLTVGLAYRWNDSISGLVGFQVSGNLNIGLAYDLTTTNFTNYNSGTYELMVRYDILRNSAVKSPRFF